MDKKSTEELARPPMQAEEVSIPIIVAEPLMPKKGEEKTVTTNLTVDQYTKLDGIRNYYRCSIMGHTVRLMIEDIWKEINGGGSREKEGRRFIR